MNLANIIRHHAANRPEDIVAFGVTTDTAARATIIDCCRKSLAPYRVPREPFLIEESPTTVFGRVRKTGLATRLPEL